MHMNRNNIRSHVALKMSKKTASHHNSTNISVVII